MDRKTAELIVKIIAVLGMIFVVIGFLILLFGVVFAYILIMSNYSFLSQYGIEGISADTSIGIIILLVIVIIVLALLVIAFKIYWSLFKFKNWARIVVVVFTVLGILMNLLELLKGTSLVIILIGIALGILVIYLFAFNKDVKKLFK